MLSPHEATPRKLASFLLEGERLEPALSPDGARVALQRDGELSIWDIDSGRPLLRFPHAGPMGPMAFSPDGRRLAVGGKGVLRILAVDVD